jgi:hypothetical protein
MGEGFEALLSAQRAACAAIAAAAPDEATRAEGEAYVARLAAGMIERNFPAPWASPPASGLTYVSFRLAGANPDYEMANARIAPGRRYCLSGRRGGADRIGIGVYTAVPAGLRLDGYVTLEDLEVDADGRFSVVLGAGEGPLGGTAASAVLLVRELYRRPGQPRAELVLEPLDGAPAPSPPADVEIRFRMAAGQITTTLHQYLSWTEAFARAPNRVGPHPPELDEVIRGDPGTNYFCGSWRLEPGQHLEIEIPKVACAYWMLQACSYWLEPIGGANCNDATAVPDPDGVVRVRIGFGPGSRPNWFDVQGRTWGTILYRTIDAAEAPAPLCRVIAG